MENTDEKSWRELKTVKTTTDILQRVAELDGAGVTELATELDRSKSSVHSHLATLAETDYLVRDGDEYRLSYQFLLFGEYVRDSSPLFQYGRTKANELAKETGHHVHLFTEELGLGINVYEARGDQADDYEYQSLKLQTREPLHITASGKAILAHLPDPRVDKIIAEHGLQQYTENTITDEDALADELSTIQEQGYATNDEEEIKGFRAVAAPVIVGDGEVLGSVSVAGPTAFLEDEFFEDRLPELVRNTANMIQVNANMSQEYP